MIVNVKLKPQYKFIQISKMEQTILLCVCMCVFAKEIVTKNQAWLQLERGSFIGTHGGLEILLLDIGGHVSAHFIII